MKRTPLKRGSKQLKRSGFKNKGKSKLKQSRLNSISIKEKSNKIEVNKAYAEMEAAGDYEYCTGCGNHNNLSHSHILGRGVRKDLEADIEGIKPHCLVRQDGSESCHSRWESGDVEKMMSLNDFWDNMEYIKKHDINKHNRIMLKVNDSKKAK